MVTKSVGNVEAAKISTMRAQPKPNFRSGSGSNINKVLDLGELTAVSMIRVCVFHISC